MALHVLRVEEPIDRGREVAVREIEVFGRQAGPAAQLSAGGTRRAVGPNSGSGDNPEGGVMSGWAKHLLPVAICLAAVASGTRVASAGIVFTVNSTDDIVDADPGNGICATTAMPPYTCTLRAAVMEANRTSGAGATIMLPAGTYPLIIPAAGADGEENGDLNLTTPANGSPEVDIVGAGEASTIVDANQIDRVLSVGAGRVAVVSGVTLRNGYTLGEGGGIRQSGQLTLVRSTIQDNYAAYGGGIVSGGQLELDYCTLSGNESLYDGGAIVSENFSILTLYHTTLADNMSAGSGAGIGIFSGILAMFYSSARGNVAGGDGGAIFNRGATVIIFASTLGTNKARDGGAIANENTAATTELIQSTIVGNTASRYGGGIASRFGQLTVTNSTISLNSADDHGGGIFNAYSPSAYSVTNVYNSTIVFNGAGADPGTSGTGGIYNEAGATFNLRNSVIAGNYIENAPVYNDCHGTFGVYGNNKFWETSGCFVTPGSTGSDSYLGSLAELGPLQDNGGPTQTHAIVAPSGMIDGADATGGCIDQNGTLSVDQRGAPRVAGARCDIGAFEYGSKPDWIFVAGFE
jgi:CSLREA domain-containing protein